MKRIAITGAEGFIGKWILKQSGRNHNFRLLLNPESKDITKLNDNYETVFPDNNIDSLSKALRDSDAVVHLAAKRPDSKDEVSRINDYFFNISYCANLFEAARVNSISNIINISSQSVYGSADKQPYSEEEEARPDSYYGLSKKTGENIADLYIRKFGMKIKSLRLAQLIGLGERKGYMVSNFINKAAAGETIQVWGEGAGRRIYVYVKDVVRAVFAALEHEETTGAFNIAMPLNVSHKELALAMNEAFGNSGNLEFLRDKKEDSSVLSIDVSKARKVLGFETEYDLNKAARDLKNEYERSQNNSNNE
ncbi:MAG: NAD-dependent epimerase/dehydratase family protein [Candidatus Kapaibacterium sp.]